MNSICRDWRSLLSALVVFQLLVDVVIALDAPVARQILCFIYLTVLPGTLLLTAFDINDLDLVERFLLSIGLSIVSVMLLGPIMGELLQSIPVLSTPILLLVMNSAFLFLCTLCYYVNRNKPLRNPNPHFALAWILLACLPVLAILGTTLVNFNGNNTLLLALMGAIALIILTASVWSGTNPCLVVFAVSIALLLHTSLITNYLVGFDVHRAYHAFETTQNSGRWNPTVSETGPYASRLNQMLSATVLPTVYSNLLDLDGTWIFKIVCPSIFALVPLGLFHFYTNYVERKAALLAALFILADMTFSAEMPGLPTQMIAEFFLVLSLIVLFHKRISPLSRTVLFTIFSIGMVVSHYGTSYVFMLLLPVAWVVSLLEKGQERIKMRIRSAHVILFFVIALCWYIYTSKSSSFMVLIDMGQHVYRTLWRDLLNPTEEVLRGVAMGGPAVSMEHWLGRGFHYITQFFVVLGVTAVLLKWKADYRVNSEYVILSALMLAFVISPLLVPSINFLNITRMYHMSLLFLAPFCVMGGELFFSFVLRVRESYVPFTLVSIVIFSLFLFETGTVYELRGDVSYSVPLSLYRMNRTHVYGRGYLTECTDVAGAQWLSSKVVLRSSTTTTTVYADSVAIYDRLISYGAFPSDHADLLLNLTFSDIPDAYVFLRSFNTLDRKIALVEGKWLNMSDVSPQFEGLDRIYTNGASEVFVSPKGQP